MPGFVRVTRKITAAERAAGKRKIKIIKPHFQYRFVAHFVGLSMLGIVLANIIVFGYYFHRSGYDVSTQLMFRTSVHSPIQQVSLLRLLGPAMAASLAISALLSVWLGVRFSHRIAGPMYRFEKTFSELRRGKRINKVVLREHDEFKEVAGEFTKTLQWFWKRIKGRK